jgi:LPS sulfotransferase NodH
MNINKRSQQDLLEEIKITANDLSGNLTHLSSIMNELDLVIKHRKNKLERAINLCNTEAFSIDNLAKQLMKTLAGN